MLAGTGHEIVNTVPGPQCMLDCQGVAHEPGLQTVIGAVREAALIRVDSPAPNEDL